MWGGMWIVGLKGKGSLLRGEGREGGDRLEGRVMKGGG